MGALNKGRKTPFLEGGTNVEYESYPVLTNIKIYTGSIVVLDVATGYARQCIAGAPGAYIGLGKAEDQDFGAAPGVSCDNTGGASGAKYIRVRRGVFPFTNSSAHPCDNTMIGAGAFGENDQTVSATNASSTLSQIGIIWRVDSGTGPGQNHGAQVWVGIGVGFGVGTAGAPGAVGHTTNVGATLVQNGGTYDIPIAYTDAVDGSVFKIPTLASGGHAATVTLPVTSMSATPVVIYVMANGTANVSGATVTYQFGTTALTTALTAQKRHVAVCVWDGTTWAVNAYVDQN